MKYFAWLFLFILASCHTQQKKTSFETQLSKVSLEDRQKLEILFHHMMTGDYFACTLFGNKPMTFQEFFEDPWKLPSAGMFNPHYFFYLEEGWKTWIKYQNQFPSSQFIFTKIPSKVGYEFIILINKDAFEKMFEENRDVFEQALGPRITVEQIFRDFEEGKKTFSKVLNDCEGLVGLVLGYGRAGSMQVYHNGMLKQQILRSTLCPLSPPMETTQLPEKIVISMKLQEKSLVQRGIKWDQLPNDVVSHDPYTELCLSSQQCEFLLPPWQERIFHILPPNFTVIKGSAEAKDLRKDYDSAMQVARETFKEKDFLNGFLEHYCKHE